MKNIKPIEGKAKGAIAICSLGCVGLITEDELKEITYSSGEKSKAYVGIHLTDKIAPIGSSWSSRDPKVIGYVYRDKLWKTAEFLKLFCS